MQIVCSIEAWGNYRSFQPPL